MARLGHPGTTDELLRGWRLSGDPHLYAKSILADLDFGGGPLKISSHRLMDSLEHLERAEYVECVGDGPLRSAGRMPRLRRLRIVQNSVLRELRFLQESQTMETLELTSCSELVDVAALLGSPVRHLTLRMCTAVDLSGLDGVELTSLVIRSRRLAGGLHVLPTALPCLATFELENREEDRNLVGLARWPTLRVVTFRGVPAADEVSELIELPRIESVHAIVVDQAAVGQARTALAAVAERGVQVELTVGR